MRNKGKALMCLGVALLSISALIVIHSEPEKAPQTLADVLVQSFKTDSANWAMEKDTTLTRSKSGLVLINDGVDIDYYVNKKCNIRLEVVYVMYSRPLMQMVSPDTVDISFEDYRKIKDGYYEVFEKAAEDRLATSREAASRAYHHREDSVANSVMNRILTCK